MNFETNLSEDFLDKLKEISHLGSTLSLLGWDQKVKMPKEGVSHRAEAFSALEGIIHERLLSDDFKDLLEKEKKKLDEGELSDKDVAIVREVSREFDRESSLPSHFVKELAQVTSESEKKWSKAREESDFSIFKPYLEKIVDLKRKEAELVGYEDSPYDALLDVYEPYLTANKVEDVLDELKSFLVPFLEKIQNSAVEIDPSILEGDFPKGKQQRFNRMVVEKMGFDSDSGRIDESVHPFTTKLNPNDVRFTVRYDENDLFYSLVPAIHEAGHALYNQGLPAENFGTPLGESVSVGIHESQSRIWELLVGKNKPFWEYFYSKLQKEFPEPFSNIGLDKFYKTLNNVKPGFIRVEADEVTYNLHIIIRFEIERDLIEGNLEVKDIPEVWNDKIKEYLGLEVTDPSQGVLQDVHWSQGSVGYFPTYSLGTLYAAQFYDSAKKDIDSLEDQFRKGEFFNFKNWLEENIHIHGKYYRPEELTKEVTGEKLNSSYFINYLEEKYTSIYNL